MQDGLDIVYQDDHIVVVNKPSGLLSIPGRGADKIDSVTTRLRMMFPDCIAQPSVHRLDMDTSGLMVLALDAVSHRCISKQFQDREVRKRYVAVLNGHIEGEGGRIELPFRLDVDNRPIQIYDEEHGKLGVTEWSKISEDEHTTRVEFRPLTGRTHQLRVHSAHAKGLGCPIVGDTFYGGHDRNAELQLHAVELEISHPDTGVKMVWLSEPEW